MTAARLVWLGLAGACGAAAGALFFTLLRATVRLYATRRWPLGLALHVGRWALLVTMFILAARRGAAPLLSAAAGTLIARLCVVRPPPVSP
jgi:hypothetical protein